MKTVSFSGDNIIYCIPQNDHIYYITQNSTNFRITVRDLTIAALDYSPTDNSTVEVDHSFTTTAVVRASIFDESSVAPEDSILFSCMYEIGGTGNIFFDRTKTS